MLIRRIITPTIHHPKQLIQLYLRCWEYVVYATAVLLICNRRFSGSLPGTLNPRYYHQQFIGQTFERLLYYYHLAQKPCDHPKLYTFTFGPVYGYCKDSRKEEHRTYKKLYCKYPLYQALICWYISIKRCICRRHVIRLSNLRPLVTSRANQCTPSAAQVKEVL